MLHNLFEWVNRTGGLLVARGWDVRWVKVLGNLFVVLVLIAAAFAIYWIVRIVFRKILLGIKRRNGGYWPEVLLKRRILSHICYFILVTIYLKAVPYIFEGIPSWIPFVGTVLRLFALYFALRVVLGFIWSIYDIKQANRTDRPVAVKGLLQFITIVVYFISAIIAISIIVGKSPLVFIGGLSAASAVLMLVFKDSITGLVAGVQMSHNDMVRIGDWITMPSQGVDGNVIDISLTTVKVRNFDLTIVTVPTYALITQSVQNWRGIQQSDSRRMQRNIYIDITTIRFCTPEMWEKFRKVPYLESLFEDVPLSSDEPTARAFPASPAAATGISSSGPSNPGSGAKDGVRPKDPGMTNVEVFMRYLEAYLGQHPHIRHSGEYTLLVRQLVVEDVGMPVQIYCYTDTSAWVKHEAIVTQVMAHAMAVVPLFELNVYQRTGQEDPRQLNWPDVRPVTKS